MRWLGLLLALSCLVSTTAVLPASAATALSAVAPAAGGLRLDASQAGDDFPDLPGRCYDREHEPVDQCRITSYAGRPWIVMWGDSHGLMYLPAIRALANKKRVNLVVMFFGSCPVSVPLPPQPRQEGVQGRTQCEDHNVQSLDYVRGLSSRGVDLKVLIGGFWSGYRQAHRRTLRARASGGQSGLTSYQERMGELADYGTPRMFKIFGNLQLDVDVLALAATVPLDPKPCTAGREPYQCDLPRRQALTGENNNRRWLKGVMEPLVNPRLIDPSPVYCDTSTCFAHVDGVNTFYDDIHLGADLTRTMRRFFVPTYNDLT